MKYYIQAFNNYASIKGRMPRNEFWQFMMFNIVFWFLSQMVDQLFGSITSFRFFAFLYQILLLAPTVSAMVRRLHDTGKSGKWVLLLVGMQFISLVLGIYIIYNSLIAGHYSNVIITLSVLITVSMLVFFIYVLSLAGNKGANKYGPDPVEVMAKEEEG